MEKLSGKSMVTLRALEEKAEHFSMKGGFRMPPIKKIHELLQELNIHHYYGESVNVVEYKNAGRRYVNSRHDGKKGYRLICNVPETDYKVVGTSTIDLDTSDSYYSWNSKSYAEQLVKLINLKRK